MNDLDLDVFSNIKNILEEKERTKITIQKYYLSTFNFFSEDTDTEI